MSALDKLKELKSKDEHPFSIHEENAIISLAFDFPEFFSTALKYLDPLLFNSPAAKYTIATILNYHEQYSHIPTRPICKRLLEDQLTEDDPYDEIFELIGTKSNPREVPFIKDSLIKWSKHKTYALLFEDEAHNAFITGDYKYIDDLIDKANRVTDAKAKGIWFLEEFNRLFEPTAVQHRTTGFKQLDEILNNGGPSPKEVVCYMAPTNVGKSIALCVSAVESLKYVNQDEGIYGQNVLLVTFELDYIKTALRCVGAITDTNIVGIPNNKEEVNNKIQSIKSKFNTDLYICELPPDECSVNDIYAIIDELRRTKGWHPDVIVIDYLELMTSRHAYYNKDEYQRQKHVSTEIRGLAKNENALIFTATQTNRSGTTADLIGLDNSAESYGKTMPLDYIISLNQSEEERQPDPPKMRFFVCKNRNGPKHRIVHCDVYYQKSLIKESV
jgi:hypothetical protein